jgi:hypothetical protein
MGTDAKVVALADMVGEGKRAVAQWEKMRKATKGAPTAEQARMMTLLMDDANANGYYRTLDGWVDRA